MTASRVAVLAAIAALVGWGLKAIAIWVAGGLDESPLENPLFALGLMAIIVAAASLGVAMAGERRLALKVLIAVGAVVIAAALSNLLSLGAAAVIPDSGGWVQDEAGLWLSALLMLGATTAWQSKRGAAQPAA
jgi:hypothetical protein